MTEKKNSPADYGTPEISKRFEVRPDLIGKGYSFRLKVTNGCAIDILLLKRFISLDTHNVLERFANDIHRAGLMGIKASSPEPRITDGSAQEIGYKAAERRAKVNKALQHVKETVGGNYHSFLVDLCMDSVSVINPDELEQITPCVAALNEFYRNHAVSYSTEDQ